MYGQRLCLPDRASVIAILELLQKLLFPAYFGDTQLLRLPPAQYSALLLQELAEKLDLYLPLFCVLDFRDVTFMDSSGIAVVISTLRRMKALGGKLQLQNLPPQPAKVLQAAGIERIAEIREECIK